VSPPASHKVMFWPAAELAGAAGLLAGLLAEPPAAQPVSATVAAVAAAIAVNNFFIGIPFGYLR
jgi:hypothetical protein